MLSIPKNAIEILDYLQLVSLGSNMIFFEKFHLSHATKLMPNTIKQTKLHTWFDIKVHVLGLDSYNCR